MKARTIKSVLKKKLEAWLASIEDDHVRELVAKNTIITGGCIVSMLLKEPVNDYDVYFRNKATAVAVANYYISRFKIAKRNGIECQIRVDERATDRVKIVIQSAGIASSTGTEKPYQYFEGRPEGEATEYVGDVMDSPGDIEETYEETKEKARQENDEWKPPYRPIFLSTNAITLAGKIQIVLRFFGEPDEIHKYYDYVHCTNYWTSWDGSLTLRQPALEAILAKELLYVGSKYPLCSIFRMRKFIKRGWSINAGQILKMAMQLNDLNLKNVAVLQDQLTGVDCAYFTEVLGKLKEKDPEKVNAAYLIEIIDRMFGADTEDRTETPQEHFDGRESSTTDAHPESGSLQAAKDKLSQNLYGMTIAEAHEKRVCINCKGPAEFVSAHGQREYEISGLCEECFDE